jgi:hypothetical protein
MVMEKIKTAFYSAIGVLVLALTAIALYFKRRADNAESDALLADTKGQDKQLERQQNEVQSEIDKVTNEDSSKLTPEERASRWGKE